MTVQSVQLEPIAMMTTRIQMVMDLQTGKNSSELLVGFQIQHLLIQTEMA